MDRYEHFRHRSQALTPDRLRSITAACLIIVTIGFCTFVYLKNRNDSSIAKDTHRIALAVEIGVGVAIDQAERKNGRLESHIDYTRL